MGISLSCFASHQTISEGEKCRVVPIIQHASYVPDFVRTGGKTMSACSARNGWGADDSGWRALGEFMPALGLERGRMKLEVSAHARRQLVSLLHHLISSLAAVEAGTGSRGDFDLEAYIKNESGSLHALLVHDEFTPLLVGAEHDAVLDRCWAYLWEGLVAHRLFALDIRGRLQPMEFAVIHEDAYQTLVERYREVPRFGQVRPDEFSIIDEAFENGQTYLEERQQKGSKLDIRLATLFPASKVAEVLTQISETTRNQRQLKDYIHTVASAALGGFMAIEDAKALLRLDVEGLFAFASLDDLGIPLCPVLFAAEEDYSNHCGGEYLSFVSRVNAKIGSRATLE